MPNTMSFCRDAETGEIVHFNVSAETGEPLLHYNTSVPTTSFKRIRKKKPVKQVKIGKFPSGYISKTKKFAKLKAHITEGSNIISHRLLLLPTLVVFPSFVCIILMALEVYLHVKCHRKNKILKDPSLYYRSPFHALTSKFCGVCKDLEVASKVENLQTRRRNRYNHLKNIVT